MDFSSALSSAARANQSLVCLGLDPDPGLMPRISVLEFNRAIIDATCDLVCAYKPNLAFYEAMGVEGLSSLEKTVAYIGGRVPVIGDAKRGDIGNTARAYARASFEVFGFDAVTANPYMGFDSVEPFLGYPGKAVFVLCRTSNPGASDFQDLPCIEAGRGPRPLYQAVAEKAAGWNRADNVGLVVGATCPEELRQIRRLCPRMTLLIPGIGAQGGDMDLAVKNGMSGEDHRALFAASRHIIYASSGPDFDRAARTAVDEMRRRINAIRRTA